MSAVRLAEHMHTLRYVDGINSPAVVRLSDIGGKDPGGVEDKHCFKLLLALLQRLGFLQLVTPVSGSFYTDCMKPSVFLNHLYSKNRTAFVRHVLGGQEDRIKQFWDGMLARPKGRAFIRSHPDLADCTPAELYNTVLLVLHEDAAPYSKASSACHVSYSSLFGRGSDILTKWLFSSCVKESGEIDIEMWAVFISDLNLCAQGILENGDRIAGKWRFPASFGKADMEALCMAWGCQSYNDVHEMCAWCRGNRSTLPHTDLRPSAPWRAPAHALSDADFISRVRTNRHHPLADARFFTVYFFRIDHMHVMDLNGTTGIWAGSVLRLLVNGDYGIGANQQERLDFLNADLDRFHQTNKSSSQLSDLRLQNLVLDGWSNLNGKLVKAANTRQLAPWVLEISIRFFTGPHAWHSSLKKVGVAINKMYSLMAASEFFMPPYSEAAFAAATLSLGKHWHGLRAYFLSIGEMHFHISPKLHYTMHFPEQNQLVNPRLVANYGEESLMGVLSKMWGKSISGPHSKTVQRHVMLRYMVLLAIVLEI